MRRIFDRGRRTADRESVEEFRPSKARQKHESRRLRPVAVLPALAVLVGVCAGIMTATDRSGALFVYLGLFGFSGFVAAVIIAVLLVRNKAFLANARVRISARTIEYTNARGKVIAFDRADSSLRALLAWVLPGPNSEGINLPSSLTLFVSDRTQSIRLRGADWEVEHLKAVVSAANTGRGGASARWDHADETSAWRALSAKQVNEVIPGTMRFWETRPLTFALLIGFGSVAALLLLVVGFALVSQ